MFHWYKAWPVGAKYINKPKMDNSTFRNTKSKNRKRRSFSIAICLRFVSVFGFKPKVGVA